MDHTNFILTGASRGLGAVVADALAARGANLLLVARSRQDLETVRARVERHGTRVLSLAVDLQDRGAPEHVVEHARRELGPIDVLVNNAALEHTGFYEDLSVSDIEQAIAVNLATPMLLTRLVLADMLARNRGHILNMASIAGLLPFAFGETYGATKHGLVGFTRALRASLKARGSAVSASALCPGFVSDTGLYRDISERYGVASHRAFGGCTSSQVARAAIRAIEHDEPEVVVNSTPVRPLAVLGVALPRITERALHAIDANAPARQFAKRRRAERAEGAATQHDRASPPRVVRVSTRPARPLRSSQLPARPTPSSMPPPPR